MNTISARSRFGMALIQDTEHNRHYCPSGQPVVRTKTGLERKVSQWRRKPSEEFLIATGLHKELIPLQQALRETQEGLLQILHGLVPRNDKRYARLKRLFTDTNTLVNQLFFKYRQDPGPRDH